MMDFTLDLFLEVDLYKTLKKSSKPILVYGMGDGAAKIINVLRAKGIEVKGIFASDDFVRYQSFMGFTVKKLSELLEEFSDPVILVAFSSKLSEVRKNVDSIRKDYELYIPDVNVSGDFFEVFDREFLIEHFDKLKAVYELLGDDLSKEFFIELIRYKLSGKVEHLDKLICTDYLSRDLSFGTFVDMGAYIGDTVKEYTDKFKSIKKIIAFEPDKRHFKKLSDLLENEFQNFKTYPLNSAASDSNGTIDFSDNNGRGSGITDQKSFDGFKFRKTKPISTVKLDDVVGDISNSASLLIKIDVEGMEEKAINGSKNTILFQKPSMVVSLYHNNRDLFTLPLLLKSLLPNSRFFLSRKQICFPAWEIELTIIS